MNAVSDFEARADQWLQIRDTLSRIPVNDMTRQVRVDLLREQLKLFTNIQEWNIFRSSLLEGKMLSHWQEDWLLSEQRVSFSDDINTLSMSIDYYVNGHPVHTIVLS